MGRPHTDWPRNVDGLRQRAQERAAATKGRADAAITLLIQQQRPITFRAIAQTAGVSSAWLYQHAEMRDRIMHLRARQETRAHALVPARERASASSKDNLIKTLAERVKCLEAENRELHKQLEVAYGLVYANTPQSS